MLPHTVATNEHRLKMKETLENFHVLPTEKTSYDYSYFTVSLINRPNICPEGQIPSIPQKVTGHLGPC